MSGRLPRRTREVEPLLAELAAAERERARLEQEVLAAQEQEARARREEANRQERLRRERRERAEEHRWRLAAEVARARAEAREQIRRELDALREAALAPTVRGIPKRRFDRGRSRRAWLAAAAVVLLMGGVSVGVSANLAPEPQVRITPPEPISESQIETVSTDWLVPPAPIQEPADNKANAKTRAKPKAKAKAKAKTVAKAPPAPDVCAGSLDPLCGLDVGSAP